MADTDSLTSELDDSDEQPGYDWTSLEFSRLLRPNAIRRMIGIAIALMVVFWPHRGDLIHRPPERRPRR